ncbi:response regulator [Nostoc sp. 106C]|uniref:hybrid sensor histidine kinase/response regulator n=1 Tax=Nostoc sp. 106C TaxID=1932667 RepID=UPI000A3C5137|nr:response regulator [Nostoc sp. 106C]OUL28656.1 hybrid sensor histidine kinase/response regulator [Nostoc sp. RF31YmG]OUL33569.1 hybrid sensor histidine kinase/response regulator [Nostoc sp. 106C]
MNQKNTVNNTILIVDDTPTNLGVLFEFLADSGFQVLVAEDGEDAIEQMEYALPDLILLDVIMPGMDGFETCRRLKAKAITQDIPIIFMTALSETVDKVKGLSLGAVDYITKPLQHEEVLARVKIHLSLRNLTKELQEHSLRLEQEIQERFKVEQELVLLTTELEQRVEARTAELQQANQQLQQEVRERILTEQALQQSETRYRIQANQLEVAFRQLQETQSQLVQSEKMSSLGQLVAGVAHEINNPVNFVYGNLTHASQYTQDLLHLLHLYAKYNPEPPLEIREQLEVIDLEFLITDLPKLLSSMKIGAERIREIIQSLKNFSRIDEAEMKPVNIHDGLDSTLLILHNRLKANTNHSGIKVIKEYGNLPAVECYAGQLNQVFMNLIANAIDSLEEYEKQQISQDAQANPSQIIIRTRIVDNNFVSIQIADNGVGMSEYIWQHLFNPFFTTKPVGKGTGLGLSISYQIISKHGGWLQCMSAPGEGAEFIITIPVRQHSSEFACLLPSSLNSSRSE